MKGDFTRDSFDPRRHYTGVLMQQGRVQLDADWNEQGAIARWHLRSALADIIGPAGGPAGNVGFAVIPPGAGANNGFSIGVGRYYVNGILCENLEPLPYSAQPGYPFDQFTTVEALAQSRAFIVYLDVWERHVSAYEADGMRETALGWIDTASRMQLVWQVKVVPNSEDLDVLDELARPSAARLRATAHQPEGEPDECSIAPEARYRGLENQLYRVEIHAGGTARNEEGMQGATFKWSRENGSVLFPIAALKSAFEADGVSRVTTVTLAAPGRDAKLGLKEGDWVELVDDVSTLRNVPEDLLRVRRVDELTVVLAGGSAAGTGSNMTLHPVLRRWDQGGEDGALWIVEDEWIELEQGVRIEFVRPPEETVQYRRGDYWLIPARSATGDVEWPLVPGGANGEREALPPAGVRHYLAPLAIVSGATGAALKVTEQRSGFAALAVPLA